MATVERDANGNLVLVDPEAAAMIEVVNKHNCGLTFEANKDRIDHFRRRAVELGKSPREVVIVVANVDDPKGAILAEALMPGFDWGAIRALDQVPFARGLAMRDGVMEFAKLVDPNIDPGLDPVTVQVVVVDFGTVQIYGV